jgi:hypothetical protein
MGDDEFLIALPALRQAFEYFPPRERETVAGHLLARRGLSGTGAVAAAGGRHRSGARRGGAALEARVDAALAREGLLTVMIMTRTTDQDHDYRPQRTIGMSAEMSQQQQAELERWRLVLGQAGESVLAGRQLGAGRGRATRRSTGCTGGTRTSTAASDRPAAAGGDGPSVLTTVDWLDDITALFPKETVERLQRDAVERYEIHDVVTDPASWPGSSRTRRCSRPSCAPST